MLNSIFGRRKTFEVNSAEIIYKVHYLGNVMTCLLKGAFLNSTNTLNLDTSFNEEINSSQLFSIDKPVRILWDNHVKHGGQAGIKMSLTLTQGGLRVDTRDHGVTEYFGHRIYLCRAHSMNPKLLIWVYQHVGKNLKTEIRCHAALCQSAKHAKAIESLLNDKLKQTFSDYKREKKRLQNSRLCNSKNGGLLQNQLGCKKRQLRSATQTYKPPVQHGMCSAPRLDDVIEEDEEEFEEIGGHMDLIEEERENTADQEEEATATKTEALLHRYDNKVSQELFLSSSSSSSMSSCYPSPTPMIEEHFEFESTMMSDSAPKAYMEVSYEFLSDLSRTQEPATKVPIKHSKSFMSKNEKNNVAISPFRRSNFSRSFTAFTSKFKQSKYEDNLSYLRDINELKELNLNENGNLSQVSRSSLSSPTLSTSSKSSSSKSSDVTDGDSK
ncbi:FAM43A-like [Brachionus plicatilis]|uniref:FAM43A-like n=1 Tax=Brachionus plicatilis TaxID=10195 RepID=A0A3M7S7M7_BRAPC|nr:FAM43A-like [Brachionus plicatilis]